MGLTEHLICARGAELDGGRARGLPTRPHHPNMGAFHPFQWLHHPGLRIAGIRVGTLSLGEGKRKVFAAGLIHSSSVFSFNPPDPPGRQLLL